MIRPPPPARLFVLLARHASIGVILRKGPKDWVQMIKWHTDTDTFEAGQWLRGEVEEYSGDLSPDGKLFLYDFFHKRLHYKLEAQEHKSDELLYYTAVSKPPYFTALELWQYLIAPVGHFIDNSTLQLYPATEQNLSSIRTINALSPINVKLKRYENDSYSYWVSIKDRFLTNHGWETIQIGKYDSVQKLDPPHVWSKSSDALRLAASYSGYVPDKQGGAHNQFAYSISTDNGKTQSLLKDVNWADFDQQGRLVLAKAGKLFAGTLENSDLKLTELADFNPNKFESVEAPAWAQKW